MKKITMFAAALAVMFSVNAQTPVPTGVVGVVGVAEGNPTNFYDKTNGTADARGIYSGNFGPKEVVTVGFTLNPDSDVATWLNSTPTNEGATRGLVLYIRNHNPIYPPTMGIWEGSGEVGSEDCFRTFDNRVDARLKKAATPINVPAWSVDADVYYIDMYLAGMYTKLASKSDFSAFIDQSITDYKQGDANTALKDGDVQLAWNGFIDLYYEIFTWEFKEDGTSAGSGNTDNNAWPPVYSYNSADEGRVLKIGGDSEATDVPVGVLGYQGFEGPDNGVADTYAEQQECGKPTGFYNTTGQKLNDEPEKGIFIVTYENCPAQKFMK